MNILGISAFYHDSAAALVRDGEIVAAAQEERFTRLKHDPSFPANAVHYCLGASKISPEDLDAVAFYEKPLIRAERLIETYLALAPRGFRSFAAAIPTWLREKSRIQHSIRRELGGRYRGPILFPEHHESHAASAFFPSPYDDAAILTADGVGEWATTTIGIGEKNRIRLLDEIRFPHSLGLLYSAFTYYTGFKVNSGEYKMMGLAPYGEAHYVDLINKHLIRTTPDGGFWLNQEFFDYTAGLTMTNERFNKLFGGPPRKPESPLTQKDMDLAASIQAVTESVMLRLASRAFERTRKRHLCLAGGVALNCVANSRILREGPFDEIWIQPAAGDAGGALGAAMLVWHQVLDRPRTVNGTDRMRGAYLGPEFSNAEIASFFESAQGTTPRECTAEEFRHCLWRGSGFFSREFLQRFHERPVRLPDDELLDSVARLMDEGKVIGWFQGRMEFGPRALGARSIIGDARNPEMQCVMNRKIKFRESFRPFAPCVLREHLREYFDLSCESPYMLLVGHVAEDKCLPLPPGEKDLWGIDKLNVRRSTIPAVTHVDYSARIQTIDADRHGRFYLLMKRFYELTGCPVIVNTSFNVRGEPIVCTPADAYRCFRHTHIDALAMGNYLVLKNSQTETADSAAYLAQFQLD